MQMCQFCHAIHKQNNVIAESFSHLFLRHDGVFQHVMQDTGHDSLLVKLQLGQDHGNAKRMNNVWFTRFSDLSLMGGFGNIIGILDHGYII